MLRKKGKPQLSLEEILALPTGDRGVAKYFHGRRAELNAFLYECGEAKRLRKGTIFLVQGAPGAGKTALLHECAERARKDGWGVAHTTPRALSDRSELASDVGTSYATSKTRNMGFSGQVGPVGWFERLVRGAWGLSLENSGRSEKQILKRVARRRGLVLVLDEAQDLRQIGEHCSAADVAIRTVLRVIHNGEVGAPLILLAGGLGTTEDAFGRFGVGRFRTGCIRHLGRLSSEEARGVVNDWLVDTGGASPDDPDLSGWIGTIAAECNDWPQHLHVFSKIAARWLRAHDGVMAKEVPPLVSTIAQTQRKEYYVTRATSISGQYRSILADLLYQKGINATLNKESVVQAFSVNQTREQATEMFDLLLYRGLLAEDPDGHYFVPIPSMRDWLVQNFARRTA